MALPETIRGLIAARLDALTSAQRSVLQDAAVVGDPFWSGALATMHVGEDIGPSLAELRRRGLIRRTSSQSMTGNDEYAFAHGLVRDVAYGRIPRAGRATRHIAVAHWLEETAGDRLEDRAEQLAHHTTEALALAIASGANEDISALQDHARRALQMAGQRQTPIDMPQAAAYFRQALELTPVGHPLRPTLLRKSTELAWRTGKVDVDEAIRAYEEAMHLALANGDEHEAAWCMRRLYFQIGFRGDTEVARQLLIEVSTCSSTRRVSRPSSWQSCTRVAPRTRCSRDGRRDRWNGRTGRCRSPIRRPSTSWRCTSEGTAGASSAIWTG